MITWLKKIIDERITRHFRDSKAPAKEVALGTAVGFFWAFTPLIGAQMSLVLLNWLIFRIFSFRFSIPIAVALVWISNPFTMPPLYYFFYLIGKPFLNLAGHETDTVSFSAFSGLFDEASAMNFWDSIVFWGKIILNDLGLPMLVGGMLFGFPFAFASYFVTLPLIVRHRKKLAEKEGISYEEWKNRHVKSRKH